PGVHHLFVLMTSASGGGRQLEAGFKQDDGSRTPFSESAVLVRAFPAWRVMIDRIVRLVSVPIDFVLIVILSTAFAKAFARVITHGGLELRDRLVAFSWIASFAVAIVASGDAAHRVILLGGGSDYL